MIRRLEHDGGRLHKTAWCAHQDVASRPSTARLPETHRNSLLLSHFKRTGCAILSA